MKLSSFDAFTKVDDAFLGRSTSGAAVSLVIWATLSVLALMELKHYLSSTIAEEFVVDTPLLRSMTVNMDITLALHCDALNLVFADRTGAVLEYGPNLKFDSAKFSAGSAKTHVRKLTTYESKSTDPRVNAIIGVLQQFATRDDESTDESHSGCRIHGHAKMIRVPTALQITLKRDNSLGNLSGFVAKVGNFSHRIDELTFGNQLHGLQLLSPLQNSLEISETKNIDYHYYVSIVPTTVLRKGRVYLSSQYAVYDYRKISRGFEVFEEHGLFFKLTHEPIAVRITEEYKMSLFRFCVRLCGIIGGVYVSVGILHNAVSWACENSKGRLSRKVRI